LKFKGLKTFEDKNPSQAKNLYFDLVKDNGYEVLKKLTSCIIGELIA